MIGDVNNKDSSTRVKFQEYQIDRSSNLKIPRTSKMIQWAIQYSGGRIKNEKQANYILIAFMVFAVVASFLLIFTGGMSDSKQNIYTPKQDINAR